MASRTTVRDGWTRVRFGEVVRLVRDRVDPETSGLSRYIAGEHMDTDDLRIRRWGEIGDGYLGPAFHMRFKPGHVLYGSRRTYLRKVALADFEGICANTTFVLESADSAVLLPEFLPYVMQAEAFHDHSIKQSKGSVNPYVNFSDLEWYEFDLPPLDEQRRAFTLLYGRRLVDEQLVYLSEAADVMRQALIEDRLAALTDTTACLPLSSFADVAYGITVDSRRRSLTATRPYLRVANVHRGAFDLTDVKKIGYTDADRGCVLQEGDVLVVEGHANADEIGRAATWRNELAVCLHQNHLIRVRPRSGLDSSYVELVLNSSIGRKHFRASAKSTSGLNTINSTVVKSLLLPVPELAAQRALVDEVASLSALTASIRRRRALLGLFKVPHVQ